MLGVIYLKICNNLIYVISGANYFFKKKHELEHESTCQQIK